MNTLKTGGYKLTENIHTNLTRDERLHKFYESGFLISKEYKGWDENGFMLACSPNTSTSGNGEAIEGVKSCVTFIYRAGHVLVKTETVDRNDDLPFDSMSQQSNFVATDVKQITDCVVEVVENYFDKYGGM